MEAAEKTVEEKKTVRKEKQRKVYKESIKAIVSYSRRRLLDYCSSQIVKFRDKDVKSAFIEMKNRVYEDSWYLDNCLKVTVNTFIDGGEIPPFPQGNSPYKKKKKKNGKNHYRGSSIDKETAKKLENAKKQIKESERDDSVHVKMESKGAENTGNGESNNAQPVAGDSQ